MEKREEKGGVWGVKMERAVSFFRVGKGGGDMRKVSKEL